MPNTATPILPCGFLVRIRVFPWFRITLSCEEKTPSVLTFSSLIIIMRKKYIKINRANKIERTISGYSFGTVSTESLSEMASTANKITGISDKNICGLVQNKNVNFLIFVLEMYIIICKFNVFLPLCAP